MYRNITINILNKKIIFLNIDLPRLQFHRELRLYGVTLKKMLYFYG